jgi:hypothetical protein
VRPEELGKWKISKIPSGIELATFQLVASASTVLPRTARGSQLVYFAISVMLLERCVHDEICCISSFVGIKKLLLNHSVRLWTEFFWLRGRIL